MTVEKINFGRLLVPNILLNDLEKNINEMMDENFAGLYENYQVDEIKLEHDKMIIKGSLK